MMTAPITYLGPGRIRLDLSGDDPPADCSPGGIGLDVGEPLETRDFVDSVGIWHALHEMTHLVEPVLVGPLSRRRRLAQVLQRHLGMLIAELA